MTPLSFREYRSKERAKQRVAAGSSFQRKLESHFFLKAKGFQLPLE